MSTAAYGQWPVFGHSRQISIIQRSLEQGTMSHAYVLYGLRGIGKKYFVSCWLKQLYCETGRVDCVDCSACQRLAERRHSDVMYLPQEEASAITIDDVRSILHFVSRSSESKLGYKCIILERAEYLTPEASNALLKTLEEAPARVLFILLAQNVNGIIPTIRSRCTLLKLLPLQDSEMRGWLQTMNVPAEQQDTIMAIAMGRPGKALELIKDNLQSYQQQIDQGWQLLANRTYDNFYSLKVWLDEIAREVKKGSSFSAADASLDRINYLELILRDCLLGKIHSNFTLPSIRQTNGVDNLTRLSVVQLLRIMAALRQLRYTIRQNVNVSLAWEYFFLQINQIKPTA